eukprot:Colp12_sorted_trinity150504_noHs@10075
MGIFSLEGQIGFYAQYHHNKVNQLVHLVGVPAILWSALAWVALASPEFIDVSFATEKGWTYFRGDVALIAISFYALYFLILEPVATTLYLPGLFGLYYSAEYLVATHENALMIATVVHVGSWIAQIAAHQIFEKRSPALLDNLFQALVLAPLFVWLEFLFFFGYRKDLCKRINQQASRDIHAWRKTLKNKGK